MKIEDLSGYSREKIEKLFRMRQPSFSATKMKEVRAVIDKVAEEGDRALIDFTMRFDGVELPPDSIPVTGQEIQEAAQGVDDSLYRALRVSIRRVGEFHRRSRPEDWTFTDELGNRLSQRCIPLSRVGIYIPGGKAAYPSTLVMTAIPAIAAGVEEIVVVSPPAAFRGPSALCAALECLPAPCEVYRVGGVQGIAALALGTETIKRVDKIVGPGNVYVTLAKKELYGYVDIDMTAGPSEVLVITDGTIPPRITAVDLLAQAEHDQDARALCVTDRPETAREVARWVEKMAEQSPRRSIIQASLRRNGRIFLVRDMEAAVLVANLISPEHLEIQTEDPHRLLPGVKNAGAIFLGRYTPEAFGDYLAGPSHVLPTGGTARFFSPLNTSSFMKFGSVVDMSDRGMESLAEHARVIAEHEGLYAHALSITARREGG